MRRFSRRVSGGHASPMPAYAFMALSSVVPLWIASQM